MNVDHLGIVITFIVLLVFLAIAFLATSGIEVIDFSQAPHSDAFDDYCRQLNIKC